MTINAPNPLRHAAGRVVRKLVGTIMCVETQDRVAALTFDDGPDPEFTPQLLSVLKRFQARATFFMVGDNVRQHPEIVQQAVDDGHAIANHSWDHPCFPLISSSERRRQMRRCESVIAPYGGLKLFRPPYGHQSVASRFDALRLGYTVVMCDIAIGDWLDRDAHWMAETMLKRIRPGSIIDLHDRVYGNVVDAALFDRGPMIEAVRLTLERLSGSMQFVTVPELVRHGESTLGFYFEPPPQDLLARLSEHPLVPKKRKLCSQSLS